MSRYTGRMTDGGSQRTIGTLATVNPTRILILSTVTLFAAALSVASPAVAQNSTRECADDEDWVLTYPPSYAERGSTFKVVATSDEEVPEVFVRVNDGEPVSMGSLLEASRRQMTLPTPDQGESMSVVFAWRQAEGTPAECIGVDTHTVPIVKAGATVGRLGVPRLEGRYRMTISPYSYDARITRKLWRFKPTCDVGACATAIYNSQILGTGHRFQLEKTGIYRAKRRRPGTTETCIVTRTAFDGSLISREEISNAYRYSVEVSLRIVEGGRLRGSYVHTYAPVPRAQRRGCTDTQTFTDRIRGRPIRR